MTDPLYEDFLLWTSGSRSADDTRARFTHISAGGNSTSLLLRNIRMDIIRDGSSDWQASYTDPYQPERTWTARSDTSTGAVLTLLARMCGLSGEIRGQLPVAEEVAP